MKTLYSIALAASLTCLANVSFGHAAPAATGWSAPVRVTKDGQFFDVGVNPQGDAASAWLSEEGLSNGGPSPLKTRFKDAGGGFGAVQIASSDPQFVTPSFKIHVDPTGTTTTVYEADQDLWTTDRPKGGKWQVAHRLNLPSHPQSVYSSTTSFNAAGDAVVAWMDLNTREIYAAERRAGSAWSAGRRIAPAAPATTYPNFTQPADVAVSEDGSAVVCLQYFERHGSHFYTNYRISTAATPSVGGSRWLRSGYLNGGGTQLKGCALAIADRGRAGLVAKRDDGRTVGFTEASAGGTWSGPVVIGAPGFNWSSGANRSFASDRAGHASLLGTDLASSTLELVSVDLWTSRWSAPVAVSDAHRIDQSSISPPYALGVAPDGFLTIAWWNLVGASGTASPDAYAVTGIAGTVGLSSPTKLLAGTPQDFEISVAVASGRKAEVALVRGTNLFGYKALYVSSFVRP